MERTSATLDIDLPLALAWFRARAEEYEMDCRLHADGAGATVSMAYGDLTIAAGTGGGTRLTIEGADSVALLNLRDMVDYQVEISDFGSAAVWARRGGAGRPPNLCIGAVVEVRDISPTFRRVRLEGDFSRFRTGGLHFRILIGPDGADWPSTDETGGTVWPGGAAAWHRPPYTIRALDPAARWMEFDIFLHEGGRITEWSAGLRPGDAVAITGPGGDGLPEADWLGLVGDETALPVIIRMIEAAPAHTRGSARIVVPCPGDVQPVRCPPGLSLDWVFRSEGASPLSALEEMAVPSGGSRYVFFAAEREEAMAARGHAARAGLARGEFRYVAYWLREAQA